MLFNPHVGVVAPSARHEHAKTTTAGVGTIEMEGGEKRQDRNCKAVRFEGKSRRDVETETSNKYGGIDRDRNDFKQNGADTGKHEGVTRMSHKGGVGSSVSGDARREVPWSRVMIQ